MGAACPIPCIAARGSGFSLSQSHEPIRHSLSLNFSCSLQSKMKPPRPYPYRAAQSTLQAEVSFQEIVLIFVGVGGDEGVDAYRKGGYHVVSLGDHFSGGKIFGLVQCRPDTSTELYSTFLSRASTTLIAGVCCFNKSTAISNDYCLLHHADDRFFGVLMLMPFEGRYEVENASHPEVFSSRVEQLMQKVSNDRVENCHEQLRT